MAALIQNVKVLYDRQNGEDVVLADDSCDNDLCQEMEKTVIRESTEKTLMKMEQYVMNKEKIIQEVIPEKTMGEIIFEALK